MWAVDPIVVSGIEHADWTWIEENTTPLQLLNRERTRNNIWNNSPGYKNASKNALGHTGSSALGIFGKVPHKEFNL